MPDLTILIGLDGNRITYTEGSNPTPGWSVDPEGTITPPGTGPGQGTFEFQLQPTLAGEASFAGFNVGSSQSLIPTSDWATINELRQFHLAPIFPSDWAVFDDDTTGKPLNLTLAYGPPKPSPGVFCNYLLKVKTSSQTYCDDPKIYTDPVT